MESSVNFGVGVGVAVGVEIEGVELSVHASASAIVNIVDSLMDNSNSSIRALTAAAIDDRPTISEIIDEVTENVEVERTEHQTIKIKAEPLPHCHDLIKSLNITDASEIAKANSLQCPFSWMVFKDIKNLGDHASDLLDDFNELFEEMKLEFRRFVNYLISSFHSFNLRLVQDSWKDINSMQKMVDKSSECKDVVMESIKEALLHIVQASKFYLYVHTEKHEKALEIFHEITPYSELSNKNKAGILGVRAALYAEHGYECVTSARSYINQAIQLDAENSVWHFTKGTILGRLRRMENNEPPSSDEIGALLDTLQLKEDPLYLAYTAEIYIEHCNKFSKYYNQINTMCDSEAIERIREKVHVHNVKAVELMNKSVELNPNCAHLLFRCGKNIMQFDKPYQNVKLGSSLIRKGLKLDPRSGYGNYAMAIYMEKHEEDIISAFEYLEKAILKNNLSAHLDLLRLNFICTDDRIGLSLSLKKMLGIYTQDAKYYSIMGELVCYYLFLDFDLPSVCNCVTKMLATKSHWQNDLNAFVSHILPFSDTESTTTVPLIDVIVNTISRAMHEEETDDRTKDIYKRLTRDIAKEAIEVKLTRSRLRIHYQNKLSDAIQKLRNSKKYREWSTATESRRRGKKKQRADRTPYEAPSNIRAKEFHKYYSGESSGPELDCVAQWVMENHFKKSEEFDDSGRRRNRSERSHRPTDDSDSSDNDVQNPNAKLSDNEDLRPRRHHESRRKSLSRSLDDSSASASPKRISTSRHDKCPSRGEREEERGKESQRFREFGRPTYEKSSTRYPKENVKPDKKTRSVYSPERKRHIERRSLSDSSSSEDYSGGEDKKNCRESDDDRRRRDRITDERDTVQSNDIRSTKSSRFYSSGERKFHPKENSDEEKSNYSHRTKYSERERSRYDRSSHSSESSENDEPKVSSKRNTERKEVAERCKSSSTKHRRAGDEVEYERNARRYDRSPPNRKTKSKDNNVTPRNYPQITGETSIENLRRLLLKRGLNSKTDDSSSDSDDLDELKKMMASLSSKLVARGEGERTKRGGNNAFEESDDDSDVSDSSFRRRKCNDAKMREQRCLDDDYRREKESTRRRKKMDDDDERRRRMPKMYKSDEGDSDNNNNNNNNSKYKNARHVENNDSYLRRNASDDDGKAADRRRRRENSEERDGGGEDDHGKYEKSDHRRPRKRLQSSERDSERDYDDRWAKEGNVYSKRNSDKKDDNCDRRKANKKHESGEEDSDRSEEYERATTDRRKTAKKYENVERDSYNSEYKYHRYSEDNEEGYSKRTRNGEDDFGAEPRRRNHKKNENRQRESDRNSEYKCISPLKRDNGYSKVNAAANEDGKSNRPGTRKKHESREDGSDDGSEYENYNFLKRLVNRYSKVNVADKDGKSDHPGTRKKYESSEDGSEDSRECENPRHSGKNYEYSKRNVVDRRRNVERGNDDSEYTKYRRLLQDNEGSCKGDAAVEDYDNSGNSERRRTRKKCGGNGENGSDDDRNRSKSKRASSSDKNDGYSKRNASDKYAAKRDKSLKECDDMKSIYSGERRDHRYPADDKLRRSLENRLNDLNLDTRKSGDHSKFRRNVKNERSFSSRASNAESSKSIRNPAQNRGNISGNSSSSEEMDTEMKGHGRR